MCLAISGEIIELESNKALVDIKGIKLWVNISLIDNSKCGDFVLVHGGFAIQKIDFEYHNFLENTLDEIMGN